MLVELTEIAVTSDGEPGMLVGFTVTSDGELGSEVPATKIEIEKASLQKFDIQGLC